MWKQLDPDGTILVGKCALGLIAAVLAIYLAKLDSPTTAQAQENEESRKTRPRLSKRTAASAVIVVTLASSLFVDTGTYFQDKDKKTKAAVRENAIDKKFAENMALEHKIQILASNSVHAALEANAGIDAANKSLATAKNGINSANHSLTTAKSKLNDLYGQQALTRQGVGNANRRLAQASVRLNETSGYVRDLVKPVHPFEFIAHLKLTPELGPLFEFSKAVRARVCKMETDPGDPDRHRDDASWSFDPDRIFIMEPCFITRLPEGPLPRDLQFGRMSVSIRSSESPPPLYGDKDIEVTGRALFARNIRPNDFLIPRPSNLEIDIDRRTGELTEYLFVEKLVDISQSFFGTHSLLDLPNMWLETRIFGITSEDKPKLAFFAYLNDTYLTNGKFPERIVVFEDPKHPVEKLFKGPMEISASRGDPASVTFRRKFTKEDLDSNLNFMNLQRMAQMTSHRTPK